MNSSHRSVRSPQLGLILLAYIAFIALGMPDGLLGVAWPSIHEGFGIPLDSLGWLLLMATSGYLISSFSSGRLTSRFGIGRVLTASTVLTGLALIAYTLVPRWWMMVALGFCAGLGAGAIDAGLNTYVAAHFSARLMQWLHASYGIGVTLGPVIMTLALATLNGWQLGYRIVGAFQLVLSICFLLTLPMWSKNNAPQKAQEEKRITDFHTPLGETLKQPRVWLSMLLFFLYVGAEVSLGAWTYTLLTESRRVPTQLAGVLAGSYWATFTIGRILAGLYSKKITIDKIIIIGISCALAGTLLLWWNPAPWTNLAAVALIGFAIAPVFPALTSGTGQRVEGKFAANTIGMQMAAGGLSGALVPAAVGVIANRISLELIPACLAALFALLLGTYLAATSRKPRQKNPVE
jgi:fucose permease